MRKHPSAVERPTYALAARTCVCLDVGPPALKPQHRKSMYCSQRVPRNAGFADSIHSPGSHSMPWFLSGASLATILYLSRFSGRVRPAWVHFAYGDSNADCLADGTPIASAGNASIRKSLTNASVADGISSKPVASAGFGIVADGTAVNKASNSLNQPESMKPDLHAPGSPLPRSTYIADVGCLADGTPIDMAGNRCLKESKGRKSPAPPVEGDILDSAPPFLPREASARDAARSSSLSVGAEGRSSGTFGSNTVKKSVRSPLQEVPEVYAIEGSSLDTEQQHPRAEDVSANLSTMPSNTDSVRKGVTDAAPSTGPSSSAANVSEGFVGPRARSSANAGVRSSTVRSTVVIDVESQNAMQKDYQVVTSRNASTESGIREDEEEEISEEVLAVAAFVASALFVDAGLFQPSSIPNTVSTRSSMQPEQSMVSASSGKGLTGVTLNLPFMGV